MAKVKVLIVDDSAIIRKKFTDNLSKFSDIEIIGTAVDPYDARDKIVSLKPDVVTLDILMPRMDGLTFLGKLMKHFPMPVIMVSGATMEGGDITLKCLEEGAFDFVAKPSALTGTDMEGFFNDLQQKIVCASQSWRKKKTFTTRSSVAASAPAKVESVNASDAKLNNMLICIGASTGGTEALSQVMKQMPAKMPPIIVTQHMPPTFTSLFASRLNTICQLTVKEAADGEEIKHSHVYIAPGGFHLKVKEFAGKMKVVLGNEPKEHHQRPAADVMFRSVNGTKRKLIGVILTGMGGDGATGLLSMKEQGAHTIAQDEESCVVFGMPKEAIKIGAAKDILSLQSIAGKIVTLVGRM